MLQTKCLVVGSCTGQKDDEGCPEELKLREADFGTAANLSKAEERAKDWMKPAGKMYTGRQHSLMMNGVERLRADFDAASFDVAIVSAGYGLISEERLIAPYNITFQGKGLPWVRERGKALQLAAMTRERFPTAAARSGGGDLPLRRCESAVKKRTMLKNKGRQSAN
jgi:hypothetical protein